MTTPESDAPLTAALADPAFTHVSAEVMGPSLWASIHNIARAYEPTAEKQAAMRAFLSSLAVLLPCGVCGQHFGALAPTAPVDSKHSLFKWTVDTHNAVNARLHKPVLSYASAVQAVRAIGSKAPTATLADTTPQAANRNGGGAWDWNTTATLLAVLAGALLVLAVCFGAAWSSANRKLRGGAPSRI
jgi:hypothetical protein